MSALPTKADMRLAVQKCPLSAISGHLLLDLFEVVQLPTFVEVLRDAFELTCALRMEHQVEQLRAGEAPDNLIDPKRLTPLTRTSLKEAFRAVAKVQRGIGAKQGFTWR
jgi:signal-transduction protein with cAMP-binding, CBS, and nucleotidyltransferase domain